MAQVLVWLIGYAVAVNLLAYAAMVLDKNKARNGTRRIRESTLLNLALMGGSLGAVVAQQTIRHKTRKEPFRSRLFGIILLQVLVFASLAVGLIITGSPEALWQVLASFGDFGKT